MGRRSDPPVKKVLPKYVTDFFDRHGIARVRFRRKGFKDHYFKAVYPSIEFEREYQACLSGDVAQPIAPGADRIAPGSIAALYARYTSKPSRLGPTETTQRKVRSILGKFREEHGHRMVADVGFEHLDAIFEEKAKEHPWQTEKLRRHLKQMFDFARKLRWINDNPVSDTDPIKAQARTKSKGYHSWTEAEIRQFEKRHPKGTKAYLALMLLLWSFQRRGDVADLGPMPEVPGMMHIAQEKSGGKTELAIPIGKPLADAITAFAYPPKWDGQTYLCTQYGKRFTKESFGNWFRDRCNEAGLPHCSAHGLRKASMRRAAEANLSNQAMKSVSGHVRDDEVAHYTKAVDQAKLAKEVITRLERAHVATSTKALDTENGK